MVKRITNVSIGDPMGFKLLEEDCGHNTLDEVLDALKCYHGDKYIVGKDIDCGLSKKPHYHIHFFSIKEIKEGALKTFRCALGKRISTLSKASRLYTGQDLPSGDPNSWLGYAIKETQVKVSGYAITDEILVASKSHMQLKNMKQVRSEKIASEQKEKKEFKQKMCDYVKDELSRIEYNDNEMYEKVVKLIIKFIMVSERVGSLKKGIVDTYALYCMIQLKGWTEDNVYNYLGYSR